MEKKSYLLKDSALLWAWCRLGVETPPFWGSFLRWKQLHSSRDTNCTKLLNVTGGIFVE